MDLESYLDGFDEEVGYLDWAAVGPLSSAVRSDSRADIELMSSGRPSGHAVVTERADDARRLVADLLDLPVEGMTLQPSASEGLLHAFFGLRGAVLLSGTEFPALTVGARRAQDARGAVTVQRLELSDGRVTPDALRGALTDDTTAVALSAVDYRTGFLADLPAIRDVIGDRLLIIDVVQAAGAADVEYAMADVVCGSGETWLRAGRGTGFAWFSEEARDRIDPVLSGYGGMMGEIDAPVVPLPWRDAKAYVIAPADPLAAARLATAAREARDVGIAEIAGLVRDRSRSLMTLADRYGFPVLTSRDEHAGIVTLAPEGQDAPALAAALANHGVAASNRGGLVRVSAHAGTGSDTIGLFGDALAEVASTRIPAATVSVIDN